MPPQWVRRFKPRGWSWWLAGAGVAVFFGLGVWQIERGQQKADYLARRAAALKLAPLSFASLSDAQLPDAANAIRVQARGHFLADQQLLLEGMPYGDRSGYDVLTPFVLEDGTRVMVNRGWIPRHSEFGGGYVANLDVTADTREIAGLWRALPAPGIRLAADNCTGQAWPRYVSYPTDADLSCLYGTTVHHGEIELDAGAPDGFVRDWSLAVGFPPARHYAYAAQWFMFALLAIYLFYRMNLRWVDVTDHSPDDAHLRP